MKKTTKSILTVLLAAISLTAVSTANRERNTLQAAAYENTVSVGKILENASLNVRAKGGYMMESGSGTEIYAKDAEKRLPIASMCKMMTLLVCFDEVNKGTLSLDETITVSERAASMGGSQVFLDANGEYKVRELIKSIIVCSANDSCVAMAERICGSESAFVDRMNEKAVEIGATNTLFANCTGLPKDPQYSCAKDVAKMLNELLKNEEYLTFSRIWMEDFLHPTGRVTGMTNTNKLVRFYEGCDAGKTGFTSEAGFCLAATAKRGEMRVISVVIGEETSDNRFQDVRNMFDYAFDNYTIKAVVDENAPLIEEVSVVGGKKKLLSVKAERPVYIFSKKGVKENITFETTLSKSVKAPVKKGVAVGEIVVFKDNVECDKVTLVAAEDVDKAGVFDRYKDVADGWCF